MSNYKGHRKVLHLFARLQSNFSCNLPVIGLPPMDAVFPRIPDAVPGGRAPPPEVPGGRLPWLVLSACCNLEWAMI